MTTHRSRDESIDSLLRQRTRDAGVAPTADCLDAGSLAAWIDNGLSPAERAAAEAHVAGCERCQTLLAAMVRTEPAPAARPWWRAAPLRWMVPIAAAATAIALWVSVAPPEPRVAAPGSTAKQARAEPPAAPDARIGSAPDSASDRLESEAPRKSSRPAARPAAPPPAKLEDRKALGALSSARAAEKADLPATEQAPAAAAPSLNEATAAPRRDLAAAGAAVEIVSPEPAFRWRALPSGRVERSTDGGASWTPQPTGEPATGLAAGSSPSRDVVWLAGRHGAVLLSTDGLTWQHRDLPEPADLVEVRATDARTATVTTLDGRRFSTRDGGSTWVPLPLQEIPAAPFYQ